MLRKILSLFFIFALLSCAIAEEPDANPFVGSWEPLYYIQDGSPLTEEENKETPVMFTFTEDSIKYLFHDGSTSNDEYSLTGSTCTTSDCSFTLEHEDLIVGVAPNIPLSFLLARIDPMVLNNPFIGTWEVLCTTGGSTSVRIMEDQEGCAIFSADSVQLVSGSDTEVYPCIYGDGMCTICSTDDSADEATVLEDVDSSVIAVCTITADGLLYYSLPGEEAPSVICAREDAVPPDYVKRFLGEWRILSYMYDGELIADFPNHVQQQKLPIIDRFVFDWPYVAQASAMSQATPVLCTYTEDSCIILYDGVQSVCTIDANGLMCIRGDDMELLFLVRIEEESVEHEPAK